MGAELQDEVLIEHANEKVKKLQKKRKKREKNSQLQIAGIQHQNANAHAAICQTWHENGHSSNAGIEVKSDCFQKKCTFKYY